MREPWDLIGYSTLASAFAKSPTPQQDIAFKLSFEIETKADQLGQAADILARQYDAGDWIAITGDPVMELIDLVGAIELAHECTFADLTVCPWSEELMEFLRRVNPRRFGVYHPLFGVAARLQDRLESGPHPTTDIHLQDYAACERYLLLTSDVRRDPACIEFLAEVQRGRLVADFGLDDFLNSPDRFARVMAKGSESESFRSQIVLGALRMIEHIRTLHDVVANLEPNAVKRRTCVQNARWAHDLEKLRDYLAVWVAKMSGWVPTLALRDGSGQWEAFVVNVLNPLVREMREYGLFSDRRVTKLWDLMPEGAEEQYAIPEPRVRAKAEAEPEETIEPEQQHEERQFRAGAEE